MMKSAGILSSAWFSACSATVSAPMLTPAKNVAANTTPSSSAMYSCHDRIRCLATYDIGKSNEPTLQCNRGRCTIAVVFSFKTIL